MPLFYPDVGRHSTSGLADQVQNYMNAADVLLIPRIASLNSANVQLGFAFSKVTVGPDYGVVGEILKQTGNPVFKPGNIDSLLDAMKTALELSGTGLGNRNHQYAMENWDWKRLTNQHVEFFRSLLNM